MTHRDVLLLYGCYLNMRYMLKRNALTKFSQHKLQYYIYAERKCINQVFQNTDFNIIYILKGNVLTKFQNTDIGTRTFNKFLESSPNYFIHTVASYDFYGGFL